MKNLLLVDYSNTMFRSLHVHRKLIHEDIFVGALFGFMQLLSSNINKLNISKVLICKDTKPYKRTELYSEYKANRKVAEPDPDFGKMIQDSKRLIDTFLDLLGVQIFGKVGYEADDFIAYLAEEYHTDFENVYILSNDSDLFYLLRFNNVFLAKKNEVYTEKSFRIDSRGLDPQFWPWITAMVGSHNDVPGIKGVGVVTAVKYFNTCRRAKDITEYAEGKYRELILRNYRLAVLPFDDMSVRVPLLKVFKEREVIRFLGRHGIEAHRYFFQAFEKVCLN